MPSLVARGKCRIKVGTHNGTSPCNNSQGLVASYELAFFAAKSTVVAGTKIASSPTNSNWFEFVGLVAGTKVGLCD